MELTLSAVSEEVHSSVEAKGLVDSQGTPEENCSRPRHSKAGSRLSYHRKINEKSADGEDSDEDDEEEPVEPVM